MNDKIKKLKSLRLSDIGDIDTAFLDSDTELELDKNQKKALSPEVNSILAREAIRKAVRDYGEEGLTINEIAKLTNLDRVTIEKHLTKLVGLREIYSLKKDRRLTLYYNNGKPLHHLGKKRIDNGKSIIEISLAQGRKDSIFFYITEKKFSILEGETPEGAIMVPVDDLEEFIESLRELYQNFGGMNYKASR